ncbi:cohesin domain-containing protein [Natronomonas sp. EA1]|uniref:cohesin domain-containing protein n=1 Tax=Natronomonas sp. EA1 TaxID=3421655 RepID=UPI003EBA1FDF
MSTTRALAVALALAVVLAAVPTASADGLAQLSFTPAVQTVEAGETFTVDLLLQSTPQIASGAYKVGVVVAYNATLVEAVAIEEGDFLSRGGVETFVNRSEIDNRQGFLVYDLERDFEDGGVAGLGTLATVTFRARETAPDATFDLRYLGARILLTDGEFQQVAATPATVTVVANPDAPAEDPAPSIPTELLVGGAVLVGVVALFGGMLLFVRRL